jgi:hypothetical protein
MNILRLRVGIRPEPEEYTFVTVVFHDPKSPPGSVIQPHPDRHICKRLQSCAGWFHVIEKMGIRAL